MVNRADSSQCDYIPYTLLAARRSAATAGPRGLAAEAYTGTQQEEETEPPPGPKTVLYSRPETPIAPRFRSITSTISTPEVVQARGSRHGITSPPGYIPHPYASSGRPPHTFTIPVSGIPLMSRRPNMFLLSDFRTNLSEPRKGKLQIYHRHLYLGWKLPVAAPRITFALRV